MKNQYNNKSSIQLPFLRQNHLSILFLTHLSSYLKEPLEVRLK
nr:MAG TPA: hypothetical protein [Caudoviricetes sp.]